MYFADLSPYRYEPGLGAGLERQGIKPLCIGWLSGNESYSKGPTSEEFRKRLLTFCRRVNRDTLTLGWHECEFCHQASGNGEIWVKCGEKMYMAPTMVSHYVSEHAYSPPTEFQEAVLAAPLPAMPPTFTRSHGEKTTFGRCPSCQLLVKIEGLPFTGAQQVVCGRCGELLLVARVHRAKTGACDEYRIDAV